MSRRLLTTFALIATTVIGVGGIVPVHAEVEEPDVEPKPNTFTARPRTGLFFNNPTNDNKAVNRLYVNRIDGAPSGSVIRIQTWSFTDEGVARALRRANLRDVDIRLLTGKRNCDDIDAMLHKFEINLDRPGSWFRCVKSSAERPHGMHQKTLLFSRTDGVDEVTLVGSSNLAEANWSQQWNDMYQFVDNHNVYTWYLDRFQDIANHIDDPWNVHYHVEEAGNLKVKFLPIDNDATPERDPILDRLNDLPVNPGGHSTQIDIAMYAMDQPRGGWIVSKLRAMQRGGANIHFLAGPEVKEDLKDALTAPGEGRIPVVERYRDWDPIDREWKSSST